MFFLIVVFIFLGNGVHICSDIDYALQTKASDIDEEYLQNTYLELENALQSLPIQMPSRTKEHAMFRLSTNISLSSFRAWKKHGHMPEVSQQKQVSDFLLRLKKRIEILWNVTYKEKFGQQAVDNYYNLIKNSMYEFPDDCFFNQGACCLNEKAIFDYLDQVIQQVVNAYLKSQSSDDSLQSDQKDEQIPFQLPKVSSILDDVMLGTFGTLMNQPSCVVQKRSSQTAQAAASSSSAEQVVTPVALLSQQSLPEWARLLQVRHCFKLKSVFCKIALNVEQIIDRNELIHKERTPAQIVECKKILSKQSCDAFELVAKENWNKTFKQYFGEQDYQKYLELVDHCLDDYYEEFLHLATIQQGHVKKLQCLVSLKAAAFIDSKIFQDIQNYIDDQKNIEIQRAHLAWLEKIQKDRQNLANQRTVSVKNFFSNRFTCLFRNPVDKLFFIYKEEKMKYMSDSCEQNFAQFLQQYQEAIDREYQESSKVVVENTHEKMKKQKALLDSNAAAAQRFYKAEEKTEKRKTIQQNKSIMAIFVKKIKELDSAWQASRSQIETQEGLQVTNLQTQMSQDWKAAARVSMQRMNNDRRELAVQLRNMQNQAEQKIQDALVVQKQSEDKAAQQQAALIAQKKESERVSTRKAEMDALKVRSDLQAIEQRYAAIIQRMQHETHEISRRLQDTQNQSAEDLRTIKASLLNAQSAQAQDQQRVLQAEQEAIAAKAQLEQFCQYFGTPTHFFQAGMVRYNGSAPAAFYAQPAQIHNQYQLTPLAPFPVDVYRNDVPSYLVPVHNATQEIVAPVETSRAAESALVCQPPVKRSGPTNFAKAFLDGSK